MAILALFVAAPAVQAEPLTCNMQSFSGADDTGYRMDIPFSLYLGSQDYNNVYVTTNGTITFGQLDATYWDYPQTPSVSLAGWDWVTWGEGAYVSYGYNSNSFCIEWSVRPFPSSTGELTQIRLVVNKFSNDAWHGEIVTFGWLPDNVRRAIRFEQNQPVVTMEAAFDVNGGMPVEVAPAPVPTSFEDPVVVPTEPAVPSPTPTETATIQPTPEPSSPMPEPSSTETFSPSPTPEPSSTESQQPLPQPTQSEVQPTLEPSSPTPTPLQSIPATQEPRSTQSSIPEPTLVFPSVEATPEASLTPAPTPSPSNNLSTESFVILENGVVLEKEVAEALEVFENVDLLFAAILTDPGKIATAFLNVGADMTPEQRKESQQVTISVIVYAQLMNGLSAANMLMRRM